LVFPDQINKTAARRAGKIDLIDISIHPFHGKKGVQAGAAYNGQGVDMQDIDHGLSEYTAQDLVYT
jgi:hypothetical protein